MAVPSLVSQLANLNLSNADDCNAGSLQLIDSRGSLKLAAPILPKPTGSGGVGGLGGIARYLPVIHGRNHDGTVVDATGGAGLFKIVSTIGTSLVLRSEGAQNNTKTDKVTFEYVLPDYYIAGDPLTVIVNAIAAANSGTISVKTVIPNLYLIASDGTTSATLTSTSAQSITTSAADWTFNVTSTTLTPGARILIELTAVITETANGGASTITVNSIRLA